MKISGIYQICSKVKPERIYIGSAVNIHKRWALHMDDLRKNKHHSRKLQRHYNKYGKEDLQFSVLICCDKNDLIKTEQYYIDSHRPYFNISPTAGSTLGMKFSIEHKQNLSRAHKGKPMAEETKKKIGDANRGKSRPIHVVIKIIETRKANGGYAHTEETKRKISELQKGKKRPKRPNWTHEPWNKGKSGIYSDEYRKKLSESHKGKKMPEEQRLKMIGRKASEESKIKRSLRSRGENNPNFGKHPSNETRQKMSDAKKGKPPWNKGRKMLTKRDVVINSN